MSELLKTISKPFTDRFSHPIFGSIAFSFFLINSDKLFQILIGLFWPDKYNPVNGWTEFLNILKVEKCFRVGLPFLSGLTFSFLILPTTDMLLGKVSAIFQRIKSNLVLVEEKKADSEKVKNSESALIALNHAYENDSQSILDYVEGRVRLFRMEGKLNIGQLCKYNQYSRKLVSQSSPVGWNAGYILQVIDSTFALVLISGKLKDSEHIQKLFGTDPGFFRANSEGVLSKVDSGRYDLETKMEKSRIILELKFAISDNIVNLPIVNRLL
ncbi:MULTISPECIES: hypothetical protein [Leptospira]|uniref:Uncharacterized protein n=1 Tax=Leptospira licerasiae str. MMD4847 TaxID=1049971 RepID=A0ABN0HCV0_9LEPT|nr:MULTISPECIES: hypothetical protein [Leptospira]EIE01331.1 hypothetical protein LEP1GSC185_3444 [Leptospira licerasiae serovar Varillal str. VAR 010]EJZ43405.1 hypothetical protein LEP1GSC178_3057 [Leptospira licerasiae str. MMD4847]